MTSKSSVEGVLLVDKPKGKTSFSLISALRKILNVQKIGHAGTLDPMATGVMILLIGKKFTTQSDQFLALDKEYISEVTLGVTTDSYDAEGKITSTSPHVPTLENIQNAFTQFQGEIEQEPPMFSAKKVQGKKLYELARQGKEIKREKVRVRLNTTLIEYNYPKLMFKVECSKGTYVRSIAHDLGKMLECGAHLSGLTRTRSGKFTLDKCLSGRLLFDTPLLEAKNFVLSHINLL